MLNAKCQFSPTEGWRREENSSRFIYLSVDGGSKIQDQNEGRLYTFKREGEKRGDSGTKDEGSLRKGIGEKVETSLGTRKDS